ncbi:MAG: ATP-binding protein [Gemmatimonadales bacterium]
MFSLRRTLAVRFSLTMFVALTLIAAWAGLAGRSAEWVAGLTIGLATLATLFGAGWLAQRAMQPVADIAAQARAVSPGRTGQRITAHANILEFHDLVQVLNAMLDRLDRGVESQRRLIADAGHDLKTPLTAMRGEVEVALRGARTPEEYRTVLVSVLDEIDHLAAISDSLMVIARLDAGSLTLNLGEIETDVLLQQAVARWRERLPNHALSMTAGDAVLEGDRRLLGLALDQMLDNVGRHTPPGTAVALAAEANNHDVRVTVTDTGPGVATSDLDALFDRFYRGDPSRTRTDHPGRAGLGLTLVKAVALAHGGDVRAAARDGGGLQVILTLPGA